MPRLENSDLHHNHRCEAKFGFGFDRRRIEYASGEKGQRTALRKWGLPKRMLEARSAA